MKNDVLIHLLRDEPVKVAHGLGFTLLTDIHNDWIRKMAFSKKDHTLLGHRGSYKTTCVAIALWLIIILKPYENTMFFRKTEDDVIEIIRQVKNILESEFSRDVVNQLYGKPLQVASSAFKIDTNLNDDPRGAAQLLGTGIKGSITGKHAHNIFTDDIVNVRDRVSRAERDEIKRQYMELQNIKQRGGRIFNTGTPWHKEDAITLMPNVERYDCYSTGLIGKETLEGLRASMTPSLFAANYELRHIASDDVIFTNPQTGADPAVLMNAKCHVDSAFYGEDYTAFTVMAKHDGKYYIYGKLWRKHVEDCYTAIKTLYDRFLCGTLYNETNADKGMVARDLRKLGMRVQTYHEKMNKHIKIVTYLKAIWPDVIFVTGTDEAYINQICDYTEDAEHDDAPDSAACMARILNKENRDYISFI